MLYCVSPDRGGEGRERERGRSERGREGGEKRKIRNQGKLQDRRSTTLIPVPMLG